AAAGRSLVLVAGGRRLVGLHRRALAADAGERVDVLLVASEEADRRAAGDATGDARADALGQDAGRDAGAESGPDAGFLVEIELAVLAGLVDEDLVVRLLRAALRQQLDVAHAGLA